MFGRFAGEEQGDAVKGVLATNNPSKRMADPSEIAKLAVYLASDDSAYIVGADFLIDGGVSAISPVGACCRQLMTVPGIGPIIASAMVAAIGNGIAFARGRDFAAWLGLVPKQISTGDRTILGRITKRGNRYLRTLFMQGARVILLRPANWAKHSFGLWLRCQRQTHRAAVKSAEMADLLSQITPRFARRAMTTFRRNLRSDDPLAIELTTALKQGDVERLSRLLAAEPELASCVVRNEKGGGRTPLHLFADWPGQIPNAAVIVQVLKRHGAELDAEAVDMRHHETPLHWAASNDDVALIDALLDAGADLERGGSSIDGGPPLSSAVGYGQWAGARRLVGRGAKTQLWHEAALGLMEVIARRVKAAPSLRGTHLSGPFWNACHGGQLAAAQYLFAHGADLNWPAPWSGQTPLDIAEQAGRSNVVAWLLENGAICGKRSG
jgi:hypothetical protein